MTSTTLPNSVQTSSSATRRRKEIWILAAIAAAARLACIIIWPIHSYSIDLYDWIFVTRAMMAGVNPYEKFHLLNWPPIWMGVLFSLGKICIQFHWQFMPVIRTFLTFADVILVVSTCALLRLVKPDARIFLPILVGICLNPLLILLTIQHGNFDVLPTIGIVWFLYFLIRFRRDANPLDWLGAAAFLGFATAAKTFPFALIPLLLVDSRRLNWQTRILGAALCIAPSILSLAPLYVLSPAQVTENVIFYRGTPGSAEFCALIVLFSSFKADLSYAPFFTAILLLSLGTLTIALQRKPLRRDADLVLLVALILIGVFAFGSAYSPQYWMWVAPLLIICYATQTQRFRRILMFVSLIVVITTVLWFAYDNTLGNFMLWWLPTPSTQNLVDAFSDVQHDLIVISLPMTLATFFLWIYGFRQLLRNWKTDP